MRSKQCFWLQSSGWSGEAGQADLALIFGGVGAITDAQNWRAIRERFPEAILMGCSTGGEIHGSDVFDESLSVTAMSFDDTALRATEAGVRTAADSFEAGCKIGGALATPDLRSVFVLSDGTRVNGSELVRGMRTAVGEDVIITGGLAGDGPRFGTTYVGLDAVPTPGRIAAVGLYGDAIRVGHGSAGGWDVFGPRRQITRSSGNVLLELDGKPALDLYKHYLGDAAQDLPGSALLFPLRIWPTDRSEESLTRTIVGIDEIKKAMIFAGDVPEGYSAQLMRGNFDRLVEGAAEAAQQAHGTRDGESVAVLVSCIGRKLLLGQRIGEEVDAVREVLGDETALTGFYSYGEVSPHFVTRCAELHNQTMTITLLSERPRA